MALTEQYLKNIQENKDLNAFISVFDSMALDRAHTIDKKIVNGEAGSLAGMIMAIKDNLVMKDIKTTCGSKILECYGY